MLKPAQVILLLVLAQTAAAEDLLEIYHQAMQGDPSLKSAQLTVDIGAAQAGQAFGQMLPQINASANWSENAQAVTQKTSRRVLVSATPPPTPLPTSPPIIKTITSSREVNNQYSGTRYYVSLSQTLVDFAKFWNWRRATRQEDQYAAELIEAQNKLISDVVERYFALLEAEDQLIYTSQEKQAVAKEREQIEKRYAKQLMKITDLYAVEARLDQIVAEEVLAESRLATSRESIRELTGSAPASLAKLTDKVEFQEIDGKIEQWIDMAASQNPALSAKVIAVDAAENNVIAQKSRHLPVVDLQLNYYDTNTGYQSSRTPEVQTQVAAINVNVPIFTGGTTSYQIDEAQQRLELSKNDNEASLRALVKETSDAFTTTNAAVKHVHAAQKALESAMKSCEAMERGLQLGAVTVGDLLQAQKTKFAAQRDLAQAKYSYLKNRIRFLHAIGSVSEQNLTEINDWLEGKH